MTHYVKFELHKKRLLIVWYSEIAFIDCSVLIDNHWFGPLLHPFNGLFSRTIWVSRPAHVAQWINHWAPCAVQRDMGGSRCSEVQSEPRSGEARPPTKESFHNNSYAHDDQRDNPG